MDKTLSRKLLAAEKVLGASLVIKGGYRCPSHSKRVHAPVGSCHALGMAVNIRCCGAGDRFAILGALIKAGFDRIGVGKSHVHVSVNPEKARLLLWVV